MIKAVFIDIDGTLLDDNKAISDNTKKVIKECKNKDIQIVLASGRSRFQTANFASDAGAGPFIISSNGADVYDLDNNIEIFSYPIPKITVNRIFEYATQNDYKIAFNYGFELNINKMFYPDEENRVRNLEYLKNVANNEKIVQCVVSNKDIQKMKEFKKFLVDEKIDIKIENESKRLIDESLPETKHYYCDLVSSGNSKGNAVRKLCDHLNLKYDEIAAIGDGVNDITMFEKAKYSVAMGNASDKVKENAKYTTFSNNEEGVLNILEKVLKNEI